MGPIETYFATIAVIFVFIGIARGYAKELGSTVIILVTIFLLAFVQNRLSNFLLGGVAEVFPGFDPESPRADLFLATVYTVLFVSATFASYSGRTLTIGGKPMPPPGGTYLSALVGLVNGYLVAGTLWFYQDLYNYPFKFFGRGIEQPLSETAQVMVELLPQRLAPSPLYLMIPIAFLLLMRARG